MAVFRYPVFGDFGNPLAELARAKREMDRILSSFSNRWPSAGFGVGSGVFPALNLSETGDTLFLEAEVPGVRADDLEISVEGSTLVLRGERQSDSPENVSYHRRERVNGRFSKSISLPYEVQADNVHAEYRDGVLRLTLPKAEHAKPRSITVKTD
ncbi:MAG: Hsp20/alpha crystallin family protein [Syntrophobacteraceae bacterium]